jgi:hypothetical protein
VYHQSKVKKAYKYLVAFVLKDLDDSIHPWITLRQGSLPLSFGIC